MNAKYRLADPLSQERLEQMYEYVGRGKLLRVILVEPTLEFAIRMIVDPHAQLAAKLTGQWMKVFKDGKDMSCLIHAGRSFSRPHGPASFFCVVPEDVSDQSACAMAVAFCDECSQRPTRELYEEVLKTIEELGFHARDITDVKEGHA